MSIPGGLATDTVTRVRAPLTDDHGTMTPDWAETPGTVEISGCSVQPATGATDEEHRAAVSTMITVYLPGRVDVDPFTDHLRFTGMPGDYEVLGTPERFTSGLLGFLDHTVVHAQRWEG